MVRLIVMEARRLQEEEESALSLSSRPSQSILTPRDGISQDELLARRLQEEEEAEVMKNRQSSKPSEVHKKR